MLNWLYPENFDTKHTEISNRRQKDTGKWLLESKEMQNLANGTGVSKLLWGYGIRRLNLSTMYLLLNTKYFDSWCWKNVSEVWLLFL